MNFKQNFKFNKIYFKNFIYLAKDEKKIVRNWRNNNKIRKWMFNDSPISINDHIQFLHNLNKDKNNFYWLVKNIRKLKKNLGVVYINKVDFLNKNAYLGIYVNPKYLSKGFGTQIFIRLKKLVFNLAKFHTLKLEVFRSNKNAINFYKKVGFNKEGMLKEVIYRNQKWNDVLVMGLINQTSKEK